MALTRHTLVLAVALATATPALGQDTRGELSEGLGLLGEGMGLILDGLVEEMRPALEQARPYFEDEVLPFLERMGELVDDLSSYDLPERLPNGDIIIRRSEDAPPLDPDPLPQPGAGGDVEL